MARVYQSGPDKRWTLDYVDVSGHRFRVRTDAQSKTEARALLSAKLTLNTKAEIMEIDNTGALSMTFDAFVKDSFLPHMKATRRQGTYENYLGYSLIVKASKLGGKLLRQIKRGDIEDYVTDRLTHGRTRHKTELAPATINREVSFIRAALYNAMGHDYIGKNPAARIKLLPEENERTRVMTEFEEGKILPLLPEWLKPIVQIATLAGLRLGEILALRYCDLRDSGISVSAASKSHKGREVPLTPDLRPLIARLTRAKGEEGPSAYVFVDPATSKAVDRHKVEDHFARALRRADVEDLHFHDLRRTFASRLAERGVSLQTIADLLGHSAVYVTLRYAFLKPDTLRDAVDKLSTALPAREVGNIPATEPALRAIGGTRT